MEFTVMEFTVMEFTVMELAMEKADSVRSFCFFGLRVLSGEAA